MDGERKPELFEAGGLGPWGEEGGNNRDTEGTDSAVRVWGSAHALPRMRASDALGSFSLEERWF